MVGPRLNLITASEDCDPIAATPYHKNVAVRLAAADSASSGATEAMSARIRSIAPRQLCRANDAYMSGLKTLTEK